ncbi:hypothetical protein HALDL1_12985 [Halobacterium sp. DL1]|nr:hypothetical protein HALDL1_12985 [Halobacterium sp. DL1]
MRSGDRRGRRDYLTDDVVESLQSILEDHQTFSETTVRAAFRAECEKFEELFQDDTSISSVRDMALHQVEQYAEDGELPEAIDVPDE